MLYKYNEIAYSTNHAPFDACKRSAMLIAIWTRKWALDRHINVDAYSWFFKGIFSIKEGWKKLRSEMIKFKYF